MLVRPGFEPTASRSADRRSTNWANRAAVYIMRGNNNKCELVLCSLFLKATQQCIMGPRKTTWLMDLQEQQMVTVFLFLQWLPSTWMSKIGRLCGCKISKYNKGSRCSERNSGNTEWCKKVSFLLPILFQVPEILKTTHAQFIVMMITNWEEYTNWHC